MEYWISILGLPRRVAALARQAEEDGWDGMSVGESPHQLPDTYLQLYAAAASTRSLKLTTVAIPATRLAATAAAAIATIHADSGGRAVLGVARGDSGHACLGLAPAPPAVFEHYIRRLHGYLSGQIVPDDVDDGRGLIPALSTLHLGHGSKTNKLHWYRDEFPTVPIDVAATGPRIIALGARLTGRVTFAVGAEKERLAWAMSTARQAIDQAGLDHPLSLGAYLPFAVHPDGDLARKQIRGAVTSFARMTVMHPSLEPAGVPAADIDIYRRIRDEYDLTSHFSASTEASLVEQLPSEFIDRFGVAGTAEECAEQLRGLSTLGLDRVILISPVELDEDAFYGDPERRDDASRERERMIRLLRH
jgi:5,10-methylenetetrahydromethanopterin reductase